MKNNQLTSMFLGLVFLSTALSVGLICKYNASMRTLQRIQPELVGPTQAQNIMQALLNDTIEYGKQTKNQDIARIVQSATGGKNAKAK